MVEQRARWSSSELCERVETWIGARRWSSSEPCERVETWIGARRWSSSELYERKASIRPLQSSDSGEFPAVPVLLKSAVQFLRPGRPGPRKMCTFDSLPLRSPHYVHHRIGIAVRWSSSELCERVETKEFDKLNHRPPPHSPQKKPQT